MRYPLATDLKTRTGVPDKDARMKNSYIETKGEQQIIRKRPGAQGGIATGSGVAQGGIGIVVNGVPTIVTVWGDTPVTDTDPGGWTNGSTYADGGSGPDTQLWTVGTTIGIPDGRRNNSIAWNGTIYCYVDSAGNFTFTSIDGLNWNSHAVAIGSYGEIIWNGSIFLIPTKVGVGVAYYYRSTDGINWTASNDGNMNNVYDTAWNGSIFCSIGDSAYSSVSTNGISWTQTGNGIFSNGGLAITWNGTVFCATSRVFSSACYVSSDGLNWTTKTLNSAGIYQFAKTIGTTICLVAVSGHVETSTDDGVTWTSSTISGGVENITSNGTILLALNSATTTTYYTSTDGINWTARALFPSSKYWLFAGYGDKFVVMDSTTVCATSSSGY